MGWSLRFERLENRCVLSEVVTSPFGAISLPIDPTINVSGAITQSGTQAVYQVTLDTEGLLVANLHSSGIQTILSLDNDQSSVLIQSEASSQNNPDDRIAQHLPAGTYYLTVSSLIGTGGFELSTNFSPAPAPGTSISEGQGAYAVTTADLNGDGKIDTVIPDYYYNQILINYGLGDGTFQSPVAIPVGSGPTDVLAAKLGTDGHLDLVVVDQLSNDLMILKGDGEGNFQVSQVISTRSGPVDVVAGDFSGDGSLDLAVAETGAGGVEIFHNQGDGIFTSASFIGSIGSPNSLTVANLNSDGRPDLAVADGESGNLVLLRGEGLDQFAPLPYQLAVGAGCSDVIEANLSGGLVPDLIAVSPITGIISIFHYDGFAYHLQGTLTAGTTPKAVVAADLSGDGKLDLAVVNYGSNNVSVFLGDGNDTFGTAITYPTGGGPIDIAAADLNGDGSPDLVTTDFVGLTITVLVNNRDGTFRSPPVVPPSAGPEDVVAADLTGNGISDLVVADTGLNKVSIFLGRGDGTFRDPIELPAGSGPEDVTVGDFTGDGIPDLAVADFNSNSVLILQGKGDGTFEPIETLDTGYGPAFIKTADLDGDGHLDLVVADYLGNDIDVFYGRGDGTFSNAVSYPVGLGPSGIAISDLNGDGRPDIAISDSASNDVDVLIATGSRTYASPISYPAGAQPWKVAVGDFNNDGHPDLIVSDALSTPPSVALLLNAGDGTFLPPASFAVIGSPYALAVGDFNGDGNLDVVTGNDAGNNLSVILGRGNGTFSPPTILAGGTDSYGIVVGDFSGDGHLDIVSANYGSSDLSTYMGRGDGTFEPAQTIPIISPDLPTITAELEGNGVPQVLVADPQAGTITVYNSQGDGTLQLLTTIQIGGSPSGLVVGDFNGDGRPDLAVTDASTGEVLILLGLGDGTFQSPIRYKVGKSPRSPVVGDFSHNGILDIAVANTGSNDVSVLMGRGDGTFETQRLYPTGLEPITLYVGDLTSNGYLDLATVNRSSGNITELIGLPGGNFTAINFPIPNVNPSSLISGDFNGDGVGDYVVGDQKNGELEVVVDPTTMIFGDIVPIMVGVGTILEASADLYHDGQSDLILANTTTGIVTIFGGWSNNTFKNRYSFPVDVSIAALTVVDLNNDGLPDILITEAGTGEVMTYLSGGNGVFSTPESTVPLPHAAPLIFPLSSGVSDIVNLDNDGQILDRVGRPGAVAEFGAPINETTGTGISVRDFAVVLTGGVPIVASLDTQRPLIYLQSTVNTGPSGVTLLHLPDEGNYTQLISADLFGNGLDDLVVINRTLDAILIFKQTSSGVFSEYGDPITVGFGPTDVTTSYLNPGGLPDLVVANGSSGDITLIARDSQGGFLVQATLAAGLAAAGTVLLSDGLKRTSPDEPVGVASGVFGPSGLADVVVIDHGTDQITILQGLPGGELAAPNLATTYSTGLAPIQVELFSLTRDGLLDIAVLNEGSNDVSIFLNNGHGGFTAMPRVDAGDNPTSLAISDVTGDGVADLVVSNASGDVLILAGNGDGTFQPYERTDGTVNLAVGDLTGSGQNDFVLTNTAQDLLTVQNPTSGVGFIQGRGDGLLAPGPVAIADMNGDGIPDLIVTNTGGNDIFVYLGLGHGNFAAPQRFFTGTAPVGLTVAYLTDNGLPDLIVANSGSNDVTILIGETLPDGTWTLVAGPRLKAGADPVSTTVADLFGQGTEDIVVVNHDGNTITVLRGLGGGFFDDNHPGVLGTGSGPVQALVGHFSPSNDPGIVILNSLSNDMTYYANVNAVARTISTGGIDPVAGVIGDFDNDGFTDLAVANNGNSLITLFDGGINGPTLAQTISLGASTHPTDLVASANGKGTVQFYVGAEGDDHAIPVYFSSIISNGTLGLVPTDNSTTDSGSFVHISSGRLTSSDESSSAIFETTQAILSPQGQESSQAGTQSSGSASALGLASAMVTTFLQVAQPLFSPSSRSLGWLLDNLVQLEQGQNAEILPLGQNELAAVAVLLSASSIASPIDGMDAGNSALPIQNEGQVIDVYIPIPSRTLQASPVDGFVANLGVTPVALSLQAGQVTSREPDFGADWVWRQRPTARIVSTARLDDGSTTSPSMIRADLTIDAEPIELVDSLVNPSIAIEPALPSGVVAVVAGVVSLAVGVTIGRRFDWAGLVGKLRPRTKVDRRETVSAPRLGRKRSDSSLSTRSTGDLPPWLLGPMGKKYRQSLLDRSLASALFRKRSQAD